MTRLDALEAAAREASPQRVQLSRAKGWRMPANTVKVARPGFWGNPYYVTRFVTRDQCVALYRDTVQGFWSPRNVENLSDAWAKWAHDIHTEWQKKHGPDFLRSVRAKLRGRNLACWCPLSQPCHADVLLELSNQDRL